MDTIINKINNNYNLWSDSMKRERTINKVKRDGVIKVIPQDGQFNRREIRGFYTGIRDGVSLNGHDTGTMLVSSQIEYM